MFLYKLQYTHTFTTPYRMINVSRQVSGDIVIVNHVVVDLLSVAVIKGAMFGLKLTELFLVLLMLGPALVGVLSVVDCILAKLCTVCVDARSVASITDVLDLVVNVEASRGVDSDVVAGGPSWDLSTPCVEVSSRMSDRSVNGEVP